MEVKDANLNVWNKWGKLKTIVLGDMYRPEFFSGLSDPKVKSALQWMAEETIEDLEGYEKILKDFGANVIRPNVEGYNIKDYFDQEQIEMDGGTKGEGFYNSSIPRPPLMVRDNFIVLGNKGFITGTDCEPLEEMFTSTFKDWRPKGSCIHAPAITSVGRDIFVNRRPFIEGSCRLREHQEKDIREAIPGGRVHKISLPGHADGSFHTVTKGGIIGLKERLAYETTFPGWDVCYLEDQGNIHMHNRNWFNIKFDVKGKWWLPGEENNHTFNGFVNDYLTHWVGYINETVFDVNVLMLDEHHCCVINSLADENKQVIEFFKKYNIEPIFVNWRHRYFWDGGLHCLTLDLEREGSLEDYWPEGREELNDFSNRILEGKNNPLGSSISDKI